MGQTLVLCGIFAGRPLRLPSKEEDQILGQIVEMGLATCRGDPLCKGETITIDHVKFSLDSRHTLLSTPRSRMGCGSLLLLWGED